MRFRKPRDTRSTKAGQLRKGRPFPTAPEVPGTLEAFRQSGHDGMACLLEGGRGKSVNVSPALHQGPGHAVDAVLRQNFTAPDRMDPARNHRVGICRSAHPPRGWLRLPLR
jgi:hypothetical protein